MVRCDAAVGRWVWGWRKVRRLKGSIWTLVKSKWIKHQVRKAEGSKPPRVHSTDVTNILLNADHRYYTPLFYDKTRHQPQFQGRVERIKMRYNRSADTQDLL